MKTEIEGFQPPDPSNPENQTSQLRKCQNERNLSIQTTMALGLNP